MILSIPITRGAGVKERESRVFGPLSKSTQFKIMLCLMASQLLKNVSTLLLRQTSKAAFL